MKLDEAAVNQQSKPSWPWEWSKNTLSVPAIGEGVAAGEPVYVFRVSGTPDLDTFVVASQSLLILARYDKTTHCFRSAFNRRIPLWEGHVRSSLESLVSALTDHHGDHDKIAEALTDYIQDTTTGFTASAYANIFREDVGNRCARSRRGNRAAIQELARCVVDEPNHVGVAKALSLLGSDPRFAPVQVDCYREFHEAARLGQFESAETGLREISRNRTYTRPQPPPKAISTIHKAKGLECQNVIVMPCSAEQFKDDALSRRLLYVAISRASHRLMLVIPRSHASPLLQPKLPVSWLFEPRFRSRTLNLRRTRRGKTIHTQHKGNVVEVRRLLGSTFDQ